MTRIGLLPFLLLFLACGDDDGSTGGAADASAPADVAILPDVRQPDAPEPDAAIAVVDAGDPDAPGPTADAGPPSGARHHFVSNTWTIPTTSSQATMLGQNIDGDGAGKIDNALGAVLAALAAQGLDPQATSDAALAAGQLIELHLVQADDLVTDPSAHWSVYEGQDHPSPDFSGAGAFAIDPGAPTDSLLPGTIVAGRFVGGPGTARVAVPLFGATPVPLDLIGVRVDAMVTAGGCSAGRIGGAVTQATLDSVVIPAMAAGLEAGVQADPGSSTSVTMLALFDDDGDGHISVAEVQGSALIQALLAPDLDLLDAGGAFNPNQDGVEDSLSVGLGFTCVGATFTAPGD